MAETQGPESLGSRSSDGDGSDGSDGNRRGSDRKNGTFSLPVQSLFSPRG